MQSDRIRNFCIIAHVDHGKSTLADRMLELTKTVDERHMKEQLLDQMDLERERGITIKLQPVRMHWQGYQLNLIDTPGHVDFAYEVSRSLAAVEGAILLVDASQGVQAQTLANLRFAREHNLTIIPVMNKIDLPSARPEEVALEVKKLLNCADDDILFASGKTGEGVREVLEAIIAKVPAPFGQVAPPRALIFDSVYDPYRGVVTYVRLQDGQLKKGDTVRFLASGIEATALEVGSFQPQFQPEPALVTGEIGYVITDVKAVREARVGDTLALASQAKETLALPGYREPLPMVYAGLYSAQGEKAEKLRDALDRLKLSDASLSFEPEFSPALGFGFRCGFLGMLHLDIVRERLERHFHLQVVITTPSVPIEVTLTDGQERTIQRASELASPGQQQLSTEAVIAWEKIGETREPWARLSLLVPDETLGAVMELLRLRRGSVTTVTHSGTGTAMVEAEAPLLHVIIDLADKLKSLTQGYASFTYELTGFRPAPLARLDILVADEPVDALAQIVHRDEAKEIGQRFVTKLKEIIPRQQFVVKLQAAIGATILAREDIAAVGKNVTAKLYGGDVTRKRKLLEKQKAGKKRLQKIGKVDVPTDAFLSLLSR